MNEVEVIAIGRDAIWTMLKVGAPVLAVALLVGLIVALFQALTQLQEMTLTFVPKIVVISLTLVAAAPFMLNTLMDFWLRIVDRIVAVG